MIAPIRIDAAPEGLAFSLGAPPFTEYEYDHAASTRLCAKVGLKYHSGRWWGRVEKTYGTPGDEVRIVRERSGATRAEVVAELEDALEEVEELLG